MAVDGPGGDESASVFGGEETPAARRSRTNADDELALRARLNFDSSSARSLRSRRAGVESDRPARPRGRRVEQPPAEHVVDDDDISARFDELATAIDAIASRIGRGGRGEPAPVMEQLRRLAATQTVLQEEMQRLSGRERPRAVSPLRPAGPAPVPSAPAAPRAATPLDLTASGLFERVERLETRVGDHEDRIETQLEVIGTQLAAVQASTSGAFVAPDVDQLRARLERVSAEVVALRSDMRSALESLKVVVDAVRSAERPRSSGTTGAVSGNVCDV